MGESSQTSGEKEKSQVTLEYGRRPHWGRENATPEQEAQALLIFVGIISVLNLGWWIGMFLTCRPALDYFCVCGFAPFILGILWWTTGWQTVKFVRRTPEVRRRFWIALALLSFVLPVYNLIRAGGDMFELSLRYHLWRAGGAEQVRAEFNQWVAGRPNLGGPSDQKFLFSSISATGGNVVRVPMIQLPSRVRYIHEHFPSRFGMALSGVANIDNVSVLTTTKILIGPKGWQPNGGLSVKHRIFGGRRRVADGIWIELGIYDK